MAWFEREAADVVGCTPLETQTVEPEEWIWVTGYKGTNKNMTCRDVTYEIGKQYTLQFAVAAQRKFRYPYKGLITTEDLFDLSLDQINSIYMTLQTEAAKSKTPDLKSENPKIPENLAIMMTVVRYVYTEKDAEIQAREQAAKNAEKRQKILDIIARRQGDELNMMSTDDLYAELKKLG